VDDGDALQGDAGLGRLDDAAKGGADLVVLVRRDRQLEGRFGRQAGRRGRSGQFPGQVEPAEETLHGCVGPPGDPGDHRDRRVRATA
jgi:hypothetical protein